MSIGGYNCKCSLGALSV